MPNEAPLKAGLELQIAIPPGGIDPSINIEAVWEEVSEKMADLLTENIMEGEEFDLKTAIRPSRHGVTYLVLILTKNV